MMTYIFYYGYLLEIGELTSWNDVPFIKNVFFFIYPYLFYIEQFQTCGPISYY